MNHDLTKYEYGYKCNKKFNRENVASGQMQAKKKNIFIHDI